MNLKIEVVPYLITRTSTQKRIDSSNSRNTAIKSINELCKNSFFLNAIIFSTDYLFESIKKYLPNDSSSIKKKERQTIKSILNIHSRATYDCTPFNTFTEISISKLKKIKQPTFQKNHKQEYFIINEVNLQLIRYILDYISKNIEKFNNISIEVNTNFWLKQNTLNFVTPDQKEIAINSILNTNEIQEIITFINKNKTIKFHEVLSYCVISFNEKTEDVIIFLKELIKLGVLRIRKNYNVLQPSRLENTIKLLKSIQNESNSLQCLIVPLSKLESLMLNLSLDSNLSFVYEELKEINSKIKLYYIKHCEIQESDYPFKHYNLIYQDLINKSVHNFDYNQAFKLATTIENYISKLNFPSLQQLELESMRGYYLKNFKERKKVLVLEFYLLYSNSDEVKLEYKTNLIKAACFKTKYTQLIEDVFKTKIQETYHLGIIHLKLEELPYLSFDECLDLKEQSNSQSVYFSVKDKEFLIHTFLSGYGRAESRFLNFFDNKIKDIYKTMNTKHNLGRKTMEFSDFSFFNANLHSELCIAELDLKQEHTYFKDSKKISLDKIFVKEEKNSIVLVDEEDNILSPLNVFLEETAEKSFLFNFFNKFTNSREVRISLLIDTINKIVEKENIDNQVIFYPKIILDNDIVLAMKHWKISIIALKIYIKDKNKIIENELVKSFLIDRNIPLMGYVQYGVGENLTKPYFIDLNNPYYLDNFISTIERNDFFIIHEYIFDDDVERNFILTWYSSLKCN
jgi:hypothetical protein